MKKIFVILASAVGVFSASSCGNQLEIAPPNAIIDEDIVAIMEGSDESKKQLVISAIANPFVKYFNVWGSPLPGGGLAPMEYCYQGIEHARSLQGNDMIIGESDATSNDLAGTSYYKGTISMTDNSINSNYAHWFGYAYAINQANLLLTYMTPAAAKASALGADGRVRGLCIRAYSYMCLMEEYCQPYLSGGKEKLGMSIYTDYNPGQAAVARASADTTWAFITRDLKEAATFVKSYTHGFSELEDFDAGVVNFLLARAYILTGKWTEAISVCDEIIKNGGYEFIANANYGCNPTGAEFDPETVVFSPVNNAFTALNVNPECILGYIKKSSYNPKDGSNRAGVHNMLNNAFSKEYAGGSQVCIDQRLYDKIAPTDVRKNAWYPKSFLYKWATTNVPAYASMKDGATHGIMDDGITMDKDDQVSFQDFCKFRYSEVVLMKAEAQAQNGDATGAEATLDLLLAARSTGPVKLTCANYPSMAGLSALEKVQLQWRIEMWGENGREYFNNKRWNIDVNRSGSANHWSQYSLSWKDMTLPIPLKEIENNDKCVQD